MAQPKITQPAPPPVKYDPTDPKNPTSRFARFFHGYVAYMDGLPMPHSCDGEMRQKAVEVAKYGTGEVVARDYRTQLLGKLVHAGTRQAPQNDSPPGTAIILALGAAGVAFGAEGACMRRILAAVQAALPKALPSAIRDCFNAMNSGLNLDVTTAGDPESVREFSMRNDYCECCSVREIYTLTAMLPPVCTCCWCKARSAASPGGRG